VYKADFTRIVKLYEHGGIWFDMDILFTKPLPEYLFTNNANMLLFRYGNVIPTGFIGGVPKSDMLTILYNHAKKITQSGQLDNYQSIGPFLWETIYRVSNKQGLVILPTEYIYPFIWNRIDALFNPTDISVIPEVTFGIHWYNGGVSTKNFINKFDKSNIQPERSLFEKLIHEL
jgi:mannosyltransferase OCH1-like enzyme